MHWLCPVELEGEPTHDYDGTVMAEIIARMLGSLPITDRAVD